MNNSSPATKGGLHKGIKELIDKALEANPSGDKLCSYSTALMLNNGNRRDLHLGKVVEGMWKQIATNWVNAGCQWRGSENWRWTLRTYLDANSKRAEVRLNRTLAKALSKSLSSEKWTNEIPTGSGLAEKGGTAPGGLDFAYCGSPGNLFLIELKIAAENPLSAAFQLVTYGLVLVLARHVHDRLRTGKQQIKLSEKWLTAKRADLRVLAPSGYYSKYRKLAWFEEQLDAAVAAYGKEHGIMMSFGFRCFERGPINEDQMLVALEQRVNWL